MRVERRLDVLRLAALKFGLYEPDLLDHVERLALERFVLDLRVVERFDEFHDLL